MMTDEAQNFDLSTFRHFGNVESAEFGCELDGMPFPCSLVDELRRGDESHYKFGIRFQGDEHGAWGLSTFVRDIYKDDEGADKTPVPDKGPIKVEGATRYQYSICSLLFAPNVSTTRGPSPDWIRRFFKNRPSCLTALRERLGNELDQFLESLRGLTFVDLAKVEEFAESLKEPTTSQGEGGAGSWGEVLSLKLWDDLKIPMIDDLGYFHDPKLTLSDISTSIAVTSPITHTAYLFPIFGMGSIVEQDDTRIHEGFHDAFKQNHVGILKRLGLPEQSEAEAWKGGPILSREYVSAIHLNRWIAGGCQ